MQFGLCASFNDTPTRRMAERAGNMAHPSSDPWLELLYALRERTGIAPIPLSEAERRCGLLDAFAGRPPPPPPVEPVQPWQPLPGDTRRAALERLRAAVSVHARETFREQIQTEPPRPEPPPKRVAVHLAAYKKTDR